MAKGPPGLEDVSNYPALVRELVERGMSHEAIAGVIGGDVLRVLRQVELVAASMSKVLALEDDIKSQDYIWVFRWEGHSTRTWTYNEAISVLAHEDI